MTIDLSGCSAERKAGSQLAHARGARVAYKALTGPLDPVNEGSFRALEVIIPEGNIMMARFPAPMAGWSIIVPTVVDDHRQRARPRDARPDAGRRTTGCSAARWCSSACIRDRSGASWCRASRAAAGAAGRSRTASRRTVSVCQGDVRNGSIEGIELKCPVLVKSRALRARLRAAPANSAAGWASTCGCATSSTASGISSAPTAAVARRGACGAASPARAAAIYLRDARRERVPDDARQPQAGGQPTPR